MWRFIAIKFLVHLSLRYFCVLLGSLLWKLIECVVGPVVCTAAGILTVLTMTSPTGGWQCAAFWNIDNVGKNSFLGKEKICWRQGGNCRFYRKYLS